MMGFLSSSGNNNGARRLVGIPTFSAPAAATSTFNFKSLFSNKMSKKAAAVKEKTKKDSKIVDESDRTEDTLQSNGVTVCDGKATHSRAISVDGTSTILESLHRHDYKNCQQQPRKPRHRSLSSSRKSSERSSCRSSSRSVSKCKRSQKGQEQTKTRCEVSPKIHGKASFDSVGRCPHHPYVQLQRLSNRTGKWKTLLDSCPLCDAMDGRYPEDTIGSIVHNRPSQSFTSSRPASKDERQNLKQRSRSHSRPRNLNCNVQSTKQRSRSHSLSRRSRQFGTPSTQRPPSSTKDPLGLDCTSEMVKKLSCKEGLFSVEFDGSTATLITSNTKNNNSDGSAAASFAKAAASLIVNQHMKKRNPRVRFIDTSEDKSFLVTQVNTRPFTPKSERNLFYYSEKDLDKFRRCTKLDILAEHAASSASILPRDTNQDQSQECDVKDTPLLQKLLFGRDGKSQPCSSSSRSTKVDKQNPKQRSRSHSRPRRQKPHDQMPKQRSRSHSQSRKKTPPTSSSSFQPHASTRTYDPLGLNCVSEMVEHLHQEGFFSVDFDRSSATIISSNTKVGNNSVCSATSSFAKAAASIRCKKEVNKRVNFIDTIIMDGPRAYCTSSPLVTTVHTRPYTTKSEKSVFYYSEKDTRKFREHTTLDILAERAASSASTVKQDSDRNSEVNDLADTPLLNKLLFEVEDANHKMTNNDGDNDNILLKDTRRKRRSMRKLLHREAFLYYL